MRWIIFSFLAVQAALAQIAIVGEVGQGASGGSWSQVLDNAGTSGKDVGDDASRTYWAAQFTAANSGTVTSVEVMVRENGTDDSGTDTLDFAIYDDNSGEPGSPLANGTISSISYNDLPNTYASTHTFSDGGFSPSVTASTVYHIVFKANQIDATENFTIRGEGTGSDSTDYGDATPTWSVDDVSFTIRATVNGES